ncbi:MAG TPA: transcriptional regulator, partial [Caulobacter sp.]|nr:transcriptional regulator [Caulobacter sp.]
VAPGGPPPGPLGEIRLESRGRGLGLIGVTTRLAAPQEVTLDELRLEAFLPADDESETMLLALAGGV